MPNKIVELKCKGCNKVLTKYGSSSTATILLSITQQLISNELLLNCDSCSTDSIFYIDNILFKLSKFYKKDPRWFNKKGSKYG